jgi:hypothetical protein
MSFEKEQKGGIYLMDTVKEDKENIQKSMKDSQNKTCYPYTYTKDVVIDDKNDIYINGMMTMILNAVEVKCLSYKSLKGFIFIIEVAEVLKSSDIRGGKNEGVVESTIRRSNILRSERQRKAKAKAAKAAKKAEEEEEEAKAKEAEEAEKEAEKAIKNGEKKAANETPDVVLKEEEKVLVEKNDFSPSNIFSASRACIQNNDIDCIKNDNENVPLNKILLKLTFLTKDSPYLKLTDLSKKLNDINISGIFDDTNKHKIVKEKDKERDFLEEAITQQELFGKHFFEEPVTFGIISCCKIVDSLYFLHLLRSKANDPLTYQVLNAMIESRDCRCPIGIIGMEYGSGYEVLYTMLTKEDQKVEAVVEKNDTSEENDLDTESASNEETETDDDNDSTSDYGNGGGFIMNHSKRGKLIGGAMKDKNKIKLYANLFFKILLMLNIVTPIDGNDSFIHVDLHKNNIMVYSEANKVRNNKYNIYIGVNGALYHETQTTSKPYTYIIDFGRIQKVNIKDIENIKKFFNELDKEKNNNNNKYNSEDTKYNHVNLDLEYSKPLYIKLINFILKEEWNYYNTHFHKGHVQSKHIYEMFLDSDALKKKINGQKCETFEEKDFNKDFDTFIKYVNGIIYFHNNAETKELKSQGQNKDKETHQKFLYKCNEMYDLKKVKLETERVRTKNNSGVVLLQKKEEYKKFHPTDLTCYQVNENIQITDGINLNDSNAQLIKKLRNSLLTGNFQDIEELKDFKTNYNKQQQPQVAAIE